MIVELPRFSVLLIVAVTGLFSGFGLAIGNLFAKYWIEPKIKNWKKKHSKMMKKIKSVGGLKK